MREDVELATYGRYLCGRHDVTDKTRRRYPLLLPGHVLQVFFRPFASPAFRRRRPPRTFEAPATQRAD